MFSPVKHHAAALRISGSADVAAIRLDVGVSKQMQLQKTVHLEGLVADGTGVRSVLAMDVLNVMSESVLSRKGLSTVVAEAASAVVVLLQFVRVGRLLRGKTLRADAAFEAPVSLGSSGMVRFLVIAKRPVARKDVAATLANDRTAVDLIDVRRQIPLEPELHAAYVTGGRVNVRVPTHVVVLQPRLVLRLVTADLAGQQLVHSLVDDLHVLLQGVLHLERQPADFARERT